MRSYRKLHLFPLEEERKKEIEKEVSRRIHGVAQLKLMGRSHTTMATLLWSFPSGGGLVSRRSIKDLLPVNPTLYLCLVWPTITNSLQSVCRRGIYGRPTFLRIRTCRLKAMPLVGQSAVNDAVSKITHRLTERPTVRTGVPLPLIVFLFSVVYGPVSRWVCYCCYPTPTTFFRSFSFYFILFPTLNDEMS